MQKFFVIGYLLFLTIIFINSGLSLKCYVCRTDQHKGCEDKMNQSFLVECPKKEGHNKVYCRKIHQKLRFRHDEDFTSIRECAYEKGPYECYMFKWVELAYQETCECEKDSCNRVNKYKPSILTIAVTVLIWILNYLIKA